MSIFSWMVANWNLNETLTYFNEWNRMSTMWNRMSVAIPPIWFKEQNQGDIKDSITSSVKDKQEILKRVY